MTEKLVYENTSFEIYRFIYKPINSNMYIICGKQENVLIIDPINNVNAQRFLAEKKIQSLIIVLTHEHYDHTNGIPFLVESYKSKVICHKHCAESLRIRRNNRPILVARLLADKYGINSEELRDFLQTNISYNYEADVIFDDEYSFFWQNKKIKLVHTPGHTLGSICIEFDNSLIFTGDTVLQNQDMTLQMLEPLLSMYKNRTKSYIDYVIGKMSIFPGHGEVFLC